MTRITWLVVACVSLGAAPLSAQTAQTANPHGVLRLECSTCHRADAWTPASVSKEFHHAPRVFPLEGAHARTTCISCHKSLDFTTAPVRCASCHSDVHKGELGTECARCHRATSFVDRPAMRLAHESTRFPLRGAHAAADCEACHVPTSPGHLQFVNRPTTCAGCHTADFVAAKTPEHASAGFSRDCAACHSVTSWSGAKFNHSITPFPLTGAHLAVACNQCHADGVYHGKPTACVSCHQTSYDGTKNPPHASAGFPTTCETCHTTKQWPGATFNHSATVFPLTGVHATTPCASCHSDGVYKGKPTDCYSCHTADYTATTNPNHAAATFPTTCVSCHTTTTWLGATFNHDATWFPIYSGTHRGRWTTCAQCHTSPTNFAVFTCLTCHQQSQTDGAHRGQTGYRYDSNACYACHRGSH